MDVVTLQAAKAAAKRAFLPADILVTAYGAKGDGTTDDTTAIQNAINACPVGGVVYLPRGTYKLTASLTINQAMTLRGSGVHGLYGSQSTTFKSIDVPTTSPYLAGAVLRMDTAATNVIEIPAVGATVHLRDFGITFGSSILFGNTGNGINCLPPVWNNTGPWNDNGLMSPHWENLMCFGHGGNKYAWAITNSLYGLFDHLHSWGGGALYFDVIGRNDGTNNQFYGGCQFNMIYGQTFVAGSADGIHIAATRSYPNNLIFNRPQMTVQDTGGIFAGVSPATSAQRPWWSAAAVKFYTIWAPDFETNVGSACVFGGTGRTIDPGGYIAGLTTWPVFESNKSGINRRLSNTLNTDIVSAESGGSQLNIWDDTQNKGWGFAGDGTLKTTLPGALQLSNGKANVASGTGAPGIAGALGDLYFRVDTPSTANQRIYICTTAGAAGSAVWTGIV